MRISDWSSDVCSSDLKVAQVVRQIDAIEAAGIYPCEVAPDYWRHVHNRLAIDRNRTPARHTREVGGDDRHERFRRHAVHRAASPAKRASTVAVSASQQ